MGVKLFCEILQFFLFYNITYIKSIQTFRLERGYLIDIINNTIAKIILLQNFPHSIV